MGHLTWPLNPPKKQNKQNKKKQNKKQQKKTKKNKSQERKSKKTQKYPKKSFSVISKIFLFWQGIQKLPFLTPWPRKRAPKNTIKIGVSAYFFGKKLCVTKRPFLDKKKPNSEIPVIIFSCLFSLSKTKNTKICWNPYFYSVLANLKKRIFQKLT